MFIKGMLQVDPSQLTRIEKEKPTRAFKKMLYALTAGAVSDKTEHETFCAVSILQQVNAGMRAIGVNNIVRLAKDDVDFYLDMEGKTDDLKEAMDHFELEVDQLEAELFQNLYLVLEHEDEHFRYLIEIKIRRSHSVGAYPVEIEVNGVFRDFKVGPGVEPPGAMKQVFESQDKYDAFQSQKLNFFNHFMAQLEQGLKTHIKVDDIRNDSKVALVRPSKPPAELAGQKKNGKMEASPVFHGYHGWDTNVVYLLLWADLCHSHSIFLHDFHMVDEMGESLMDVGVTGFNAGEVDTMNTETDLSAPVGADFTAHEASGLDISSSSGGGFFDFGGDGGDSCGDGSSCSSCSSCGGGCGGCS